MRTHWNVPGRVVLFPGQTELFLFSEDVNTESGIRIIEVRTDLATEASCKFGVQNASQKLGLIINSLEWTVRELKLALSKLPGLLQP